VNGAPETSKVLHRLWLPLLLTAGLSSPAVAQIGLQSQTAQITLLARSVPHGSIQSVAPRDRTAPAGGVIGGSMTVRFSANSGYRLMARSTGVSGSRVWVRDVNGEYQELTGRSAITVAQDSHTAGAAEREIQYRIEGAQGSTGEIPIRYEMVIEPTI
jgi:hypothetical protein